MSPTGLRSDPVQQYLYARVAAGYWKPSTRTTANAIARSRFDAGALQEMEKVPVCSGSQACRYGSGADPGADAEAARAFTPVPRAGIQPRRPGAKASKGYGFVASTIDYHHECAWNLAANCRGAQRLASST
jgi:hypothetical protein